MKLASTVIAGLLLADRVSAFVPQSVVQTQRRNARNSQRFMAMDVQAPASPPDESNVPVVQQNSYGQPTEVRYSDFLSLVNKDRIEKVTFSADGTQLLGVDVDGARIRIEALPNDPDLLTSLTTHKVSEMENNGLYFASSAQKVIY